MNSSVSALDRTSAALAYIMPLGTILPAGFIFLTTYSSTGLTAVVETVLSSLGPLLFILAPLLSLTRGTAGFVVFILLFAFVVRNPNISRFIRFNVLQAVLVSFVASVLMLITTLPGLSLLAVPVFSLVFLVGFVIVIYSVIQSLLGRYADIPTISDAINTQLPY